MTATKTVALKQITKGKEVRPVKILLYGVPGVGKTTFGAGAPSPIFIPTEDGTSNLDVARFPVARNWEDIVGAVAALRGEEHTYKTVIIDTAKGLEDLLNAHVVARHNSMSKEKVESIEGVAYGKLWVAGDIELKRLMGSLDSLVYDKKMNVVITAHQAIQIKSEPDREQFEQMTPGIAKRYQETINGWCDCILFARYETLDAKMKGKQVSRAIATGVRKLFTSFTGAYVAKNRYSLPAELPLSWVDLEAAILEGPTADSVTKSIREKIAQLDETKRAAVEAAITRAAGSLDVLKIVENRVDAVITEREAA